MEEWKKIEGLGDAEYEVSNEGNVRRAAKTTVYIDGRVTSYSTRQRKLLKDPDGYFRTTFRLSKNLCVARRVHRLVAGAFMPNPENKPCVNHINGIKTDNRVSNLEWCTVKHNNIHAIETGLKKVYGMNNKLSKLTDSDVIKIRQIGTSQSYSETARQFKTNGTNIANIIRRKAWKHI